MFDVLNRLCQLPLKQSPSRNNGMEVFHYIIVRSFAIQLATHN